jgi:hypothetical protein
MRAAGGRHSGARADCSESLSHRLQLRLEPCAALAAGQMRHHRLANLLFHQVARIQLVVHVFMQMSTRVVASERGIEVKVTPYVVDWSRPARTRLE